MFFPAHCYSSNVSAYRPVAISCISRSPPLWITVFLTFIPPQWLKMCVCFSAKLHHTQPLFHELFPPRIFTCTEASNCQRPPVTSAIFSFPPSSSYEEKYLFSFIKASYLRGGENCSVCNTPCTRMSGESAAMLGVIMKRLKCDRRFLWLGIKQHLIYLNKPQCSFICTQMCARKG